MHAYIEITCTSLWVRDLPLSVHLTVTRAMMYHPSTIRIHNCITYVAHTRPVTGRNMYIGTASIHMKLYILPVDIIIFIVPECVGVSFDVVRCVYH